MAKNKRKKQKRQGHYCWCCQNMLPNERFSGKGHARHLCKACKRLPGEEREFRSERNNLERCLTWEGIIPKKRWRQFLKFLEHPHPIIRALAEQMQREDAQERGWKREANETREIDWTGDVNLDFDIAASQPVGELTDSAFGESLSRLIGE
jgi:hypothetical protein